MNLHRTHREPHALTAMPDPQRTDEAIYQRRCNCDACQMRREEDRFEQSAYTAAEQSRIAQAEQELRADLREVAMRYWALTREAGE